MDESSSKSKPGEAALQNMKLLKTESTLFKVPKVPKKKIAQKTRVLDEDEYVEGLSKIIQRDFFPDLEKLKAQNEFLEATENKDYAKLREITQKYSGQRPPTEPYNTPATFDTPDIGRLQSPLPETVREHRDTGSVVEVKKQKDITDNHTLDSFLASHTSEDNSSYDRIISLEERKRANKLAAQLNAEVSSLALVEKAVALPSIEEQADQTARPDELDTWKYKAKNYIMYVPDGAKSQLPPPKPELHHHNTRLKAPPFDPIRNKETISALAKNQSCCVSGKIGVDGCHVPAASGAAGVAGAVAAGGVAGAVAAGGRYSLVRTPSPAPGAAASPLMTWGEIEGTPFRLDGGDTPLPHVGAGAAYHILEGGVRERLALQLAENVAKTRRLATPRLATGKPSNYRTNTERLASMSPAARKLAAKHLLSPRLRLTPNDMGIFHPTTPKRTPTPHRRPLVATPKKLATPNRMNVNVASANCADNNLTDNLLQINVAKRSRLKAQDFFE